MHLFTSTGSGTLPAVNFATDLVGLKTANFPNTTKHGRAFGRGLMLLVFGALPYHSPGVSSPRLYVL
jgi:hypothetical protein